VAGLGALLLLSGLLGVHGPSTGWAADTNIFPGTGNAGIGTIAPTAPLHIKAAVSAYGAVQFKVEDGTTGGYFSVGEGAGGAGIYLPIFRFQGIGFNGYSGAVLGAIPTANDVLAAGGAAMIIQGQRADNTALQAANVLHVKNYSTSLMVVNKSGYVGIGTMAPTAKLHVIGDAIVSGNIAAKYQDVAEWVPTKTALLPGTVVIIDPQATNQVLPAATPYDTRVAGVVSTQPGILLGEAGDDKVKITHSGRVPVKVDASFGPIAAGDLLVTSPTAGHAMRSTPVDLGGVPIHRPGTLVGKALEPLDNGQGEILVLLTLQ